MTTLQHVYLSAHGRYKDAPWQDEIAQMGLRLAITHGLAEPARGTPFDIPTWNGEIALDTTTTPGTNGTLSQGWKARLGPEPSSLNADAAWQIDLAEDFHTMLNAVKGYTAAGFEWSHIKIAPVDSLGHYGGFGASTYDFTAPIVGTSTADMLPPEVALCISLRAPVSGRRGRGRMYYPALGVTSVQENGEAVPGTRTSLANAAAQLVDDLEDGTGLDVYAPTVMVTSAGRASAVRPSEIRVGSHFDVQRRRQDQAQEEYVTVAL